MFFPLFLTSVPVLVVAVLVTLAVTRFRILPRGMSQWLFTWTLALAIQAALASWFTIELIIIDGARAQRRVLGRQYASALQLIAYHDTEFPDPGQDWEYRLDDQLAATLRMRCLPSVNLGPNHCYLYQRSNNRSLEAVELTDNHLIIRDYSL